MFTVHRIETIHYTREYSRDEVLDLMSLVELELPPCVGLDIRAQYKSLSDGELALAFQSELRRGGSTTRDAVCEDTERYGNVQENDFSVELAECSSE